jgi:hypothetical protein
LFINKSLFLNAQQHFIVAVGGKKKNVMAGDPGV